MASEGDILKHYAEQADARMAMKRDNMAFKALYGAPRKVGTRYFPGVGAVNVPVGGSRRRYTPRRRYTRRFVGRRKGTIRGRGGYFGDLLSSFNSKFIPKHWGIGTPSDWRNAGNFGEEVANIVGKGRYNKRLRGLGAYGERDVAPGALVQEVPTISNPGGRDGCVTIRHKEYVMDVVSAASNGTSPFNIVATLPINPGLPSTFPWLSTLADSFTEYQLSGLVFYFKSTSGALSTTQALGEVIMAANYNVLAPVFTTKAQMLNEVFSTSKVPSEDAIMPIECEPGQTPISQMYVRSGAVPTGQDARFYDWGSFTIATQGQTNGNANVTLGELWVSYQVDFFKPQLPAQVTGGGGANLMAHYNLATSWSGGTPFGTNHVPVFDNIGGTVSGASYLFPFPSPAAVFFVYIGWYGASTAVTIPLVTGSNSSLGQNFRNHQDSNENETGVTVTNCNIAFTIIGPALPGVAWGFNLSTNGTLPGTPTGGDMYIIQLNPDFSALVS